MLTKLTTAFGVVLVTGSIAFAAQATPSTHANEAATKPAATQTAPSVQQNKKAANSKSHATRHRKHYKSHATATSSASKSTAPKQ
jgi:hypothetical protein